MTADLVRPNPLRWVLYAYGARLPRRHSAWVLHDVSAPTWVLRHLTRSVAQLLPIAVALYLLLPGEAWVRGMAVLAGLLIGWFYSFAFLIESAENRAMKAGHPRGAAAAARAARRGDVDRAERERYAERWRR